MDKFMKYFYLYGVVAFIVVGIASIYTNYYYWPIKLFSEKASAVVITIFYFLLAVSFHRLYKTTSVMSSGDLSDDEIKKIFDEEIKKVKQA